MTNLEKYTDAFVQCFGVEAIDAAKLKYQDIKAWDSVGHMGLIAMLEESFGIMLEMDDIIDLSSFDKGKEILSQKYSIEF